MWSFSVKSYLEKGQGWINNGCTELKFARGRYYLTLTWAYRAKHINDHVFFAFNKPYTYSHLLDYVNQLEPKNPD